MAKTYNAYITDELRLRALRLEADKLKGGEMKIGELDITMKLERDLVKVTTPFVQPELVYSFYEPELDLLFDR